MDYITLIIIASCSFLFITATVEHYTKKSIFPYVVWILVLGLFYGYIQKQGIVTLPQLAVNPKITINVLLPILIFESTFKFKFNKLKSALIPILVFSILGVALSIVLIGWPLSHILGISMMSALLFGAILAPTDPIAILAILKNFPLPEKLRFILEGESLLNDGAAVIFFAFLWSMVNKEVMTSAYTIPLMLIVKLIGALLIGAITAFIVSHIIKAWTKDNHEFQDTTMSIVTAYTSFVIAEHIFHVSGMVAVIASALVFGNSGHCYSCIMNKSISPLRFVQKFWSYLGNIVNSVIFFLLGAQFGIHNFVLSAPIIFITIIILIFSRIVVVYGLSYFLAKIGHKLKLAWQHILNIGGLRGALSVSLILTLPESYQYKETFLCLALVVILFTLVVNTLGIQYIIKRNKL